MEKWSIQIAWTLFPRLRSGRQLSTWRTNTTMNIIIWHWSTCGRAFLWSITAGLGQSSDIRILEMNSDFVVLQKAGHYAETQQMFDELSESIGVLQFIRSGRVAITRSKVERLSDMLDAIQEKHGDK